MGLHSRSRSEIPPRSPKMVDDAEGRRSRRGGAETVTIADGSHARAYHAQTGSKKRSSAAALELDTPPSDGAGSLYNSSQASSVGGNSSSIAGGSSSSRSSPITSSEIPSQSAGSHAAYMSRSGYPLAPASMTRKRTTSSDSLRNLQLVPNSPGATDEPQQQPRSASRAADSPMEAQGSSSRPSSSLDHRGLAARDEREQSSGPSPEHLRRALAQEVNGARGITPYRDGAAGRSSPILSGNATMTGETSASTTIRAPSAHAPREQSPPMLQQQQHQPAQPRAYVLADADIENHPDYSAPQQSRAIHRDYASHSTPGALQHPAAAAPAPTPRQILGEVSRVPSSQPPGAPLAQHQQQHQPLTNGAVPMGMPQAQYRATKSTNGRVMMEEYHEPLKMASPGMGEQTPSMGQQHFYHRQPLAQQQQGGPTPQQHQYQQQQQYQPQRPPPAAPLPAVPSSTQQASKRSKSYIYVSRVTLLLSGKG